jgi:holo-[acyl-carrier protein] synthase
MIVGLGLDLCEVSRMADLLGRWGERFVDKIFTPAERAYCRERAHPAQHFAARFAAREATLKALGVPKGLRWHEMEVVSRAGKPELVLSGEAAAVATARGVTRTHLTITHAADVAAAVVILES